MSSRFFSAHVIAATMVCATLLWPNPACATSARQPAVSKTLSPSQKLQQLGERYFQESLRLNPIDGSYTLGEDRFNGQLVIGIAPIEVAKEKALQERLLRDTASLLNTTLSPADQLSLTLLRNQAQIKLEAHAFPKAWLPIDQYGGIPSTLAQFATGQSAQPLKTVKNYEDLLKRLEKVPAWNRQAMRNIRLGIDHGVVQPKALIERAVETLQPLTTKQLEAHPYYLPIQNFPVEFTTAQREYLTRQYRVAITRRLQPSMEQFVQFLRTDYLPKGRDTAGIGALPNGKAWYAQSVRQHTTTNLSPDEIHKIGLAEVARINSEIAKIQAHYQFQGTTAQFVQHHVQQSAFLPFKTDQDVLDAFEKLNRKIQAELPKFFARSPKAQLVIRAEPEITKATASAHYDMPSPDGRRPGTFFAVIMDPKEYPTTEMTSLFLHEGQPGHHFHLAGQQELPLPNFRKYDWINAYGEGWALYAETLGHEMGLYQDPNAHLGHLTMELLRAVRLVTDTGLHAKGWTREQSIQYMIDIEGQTPLDARRATERYIADPGQALAYKLGALKIRELRDRAQAAFGSRFSYATFHEQVLSDGALPLNLLEEKIDRWIAQEGKQSRQ